MTSINKPYLLRDATPSRLQQLHEATLRLLELLATHKLEEDLLQKSIEALTTLIGACSKPEVRQNRWERIWTAAGWARAVRARAKDRECPQESSRAWGAILRNPYRNKPPKKTYILKWQAPSAGAVGTNIALLPSPMANNLILYGLKAYFGKSSVTLA